MENTNTSAFSNDNAAQETIDGSALVEISEDFMKGFVVISPSFNDGTPVTVDDVMAEVEKSKIQIDINKQAIEDAISQKHFHRRICVAKGKAPVHGLDGVIKYRYDAHSVLSPKENEKGVMDYKDLGLVHNITGGAVIADITPETEGEDGFDVHGTLHKAMPGKKAKFLVGKGTVINEEQTIITAEIDGNLRWHRDHFTVESTVTISDDVGATTGNIDFIGDVVIKGGVQENFSIISKKNILIHGNVNNAKIIAEGNIEIKTGSINSEISARGNVKIGFCESSKIDCTGDLSSASFVACDIFCQGSVVATSGKGIIVGGKMTCLKEITSNTIGSESYTKTRLTLGNGAILAEEKFALEKEEATLTEQIGKLIQISNLLNEHKKKAGKLSAEREDMLSQTIRTRFKYSNDIKLIKKRIEEIDDSILNTYNLHIDARKAVWPGVTVRIGTMQVKIENKSDRCRICMNDSGDIEIKPITGSTS